MEILKEEKICNNECPKCGSVLEGGSLKKREGAKWWSSNYYSNNRWFYCYKCNRRYLIKDDAYEVQHE